MLQQKFYNSQIFLILRLLNLFWHHLIFVEPTTFCSTDAFYFSAVYGNWTLSPFANDHTIIFYKWKLLYLHILLFTLCLYFISSFLLLSCNRYMVLNSFKKLNFSTLNLTTFLFQKIKKSNTHKTFCNILKMCRINLKVYNVLIYTPTVSINFQNKCFL